MSLPKLLREIAETLALALVIFLIVHIGVQNFRVQGTSMIPTLHTGNLVLVNKIDYDFENPQPGDVIVFKFPLDPSQDFIKRVIGVPGDVIRITPGHVYRDGRLVHEPYIKNETNYSFGPKKVPKNDYFVLGDNRPSSYDSHLWGMLPRKNIIGKALISYWPLNSITFFSF